MLNSSKQSNTLNNNKPTDRGFVVEDIRSPLSSMPRAVEAPLVSNF